jgi:hypothetical protein
MTALREGMPSLNQLAELEPLSTGDIIDRAVQIYRHNFGPLLAIAAVPALATYAGTLMATYGTSAITRGTTVFGAVMLAAGYLLTYLIGPVLMMLVIGGLTRTVADFIMLDTPISFRRTFKLIQGRVWTLIGAQLIGLILVGLVMLMAFFVLMFVFFAIIGILSFIIPNLPTALGIALVLLAALVFGAAILIGYSYAFSKVIFIPCSIMIEGQTASGSLTRAFKLSGNTVWRVLQIIMFDFAIASAVISAVGIPLVIYGFITGEISDPRTLPTWFLIAFSTVDQLGKLLTLPIATIAYCLLYFDCRVRQEGYDVELMVGRLAPTAPAQTSYNQPMPPRAPQYPQYPQYPGGYRPSPPAGSVLGL